MSLPLIEHWDGRAWTRVPSPAIPRQATLERRGHCLPGQRLGGRSYDNPSLARAPPDRALGRPGLDQGAQPGPGRRGTLSGVAALSPASAWAVGTGSLCPGHRQTTLIEHWDGRAWTPVPSPAAGTLTAVTAASPDSAWAVGSISSGGGGPAVIEHWNGKTWTWPTGCAAAPPAPAASSPALPLHPSSPSRPRTRCRDLITEMITREMRDGTAVHRRSAGGEAQRRSASRGRGTAWRTAA